MRNRKSEQKSKFFERCQELEMTLSVGTPCCRDGVSGVWAKGVLAEALESVTKQRSARLVLANAAYSSQVNSRTGCLEDKRKGDHFITSAGEVLPGTFVTGLMILILRGICLLYKDVRKILLRRSSGGVLPLKRLEFGAGNSTSTECG